MRRIFLFFMTLALCVGSVCASAQTLKSRPLTTSAFKTVLFLSQTIDLAGAQSSEASIAPLTVSSGGFAANRAVTKVSGALIGSMPAMVIPDPATSAQALAIAVDWMNLYATPFINSMGSYLTKQGLSNGFYAFSQEFDLSVVDATTGATSSKKMAMTWTANFDASSRPIYGEPKITDPDPVYIHAVLTPGSTVSGLPTSWSSVYESPGTLRYVVLNKNFVQLGDWVSISVGTVFDEDDTGSDKLACLMDGRYPGCAGPIDIQTLMTKYGATTAFVDYIRQIQPVYVDDGTGTGSQVPKGAASYDTRVVTCSALNNSGFYGYALQFEAERYLAVQTTSLVTWQAIEQFAGKGVSPTEAFAKTTALSSVSDPNLQLLNYQDGGTDFLSRTSATDMANVIYVADLRSQTGDSGTMTMTDNQGALNSNLISQVGNTNIYQLGYVCDNCLSAGAHDVTGTWYLSDPASASEFAMIEEGIDDWMLVQVNGVTVFIGPYGGDMLEVSAGDGVSVPLNICSWNTDGSYTCPVGAAYGDLQGYTTDCTLDGSTAGCLACPAGQTAVGRGCYLASNVNYNWCYEYGASGGDGATGPTNLICGNLCPSGWVQYLSSPRMGYDPGGSGWAVAGTGCGQIDQNTSRVLSTYVDLRPYLHSGYNTIRFKVLVGGLGEGWIKIRTAGCAAASVAPSGDSPAVPATAGSAGVTAANAAAAQ